MKPHPTIKVLICHQNQDFRCTIKRMFEIFSETIVVVAECEHEQLLAFNLNKHQIDIVLIKFKTHDFSDRLETMRTLSQEYPEVKVIAISFNKSLSYKRKLNDIGVAVYQTDDDIQNLIDMCESLGK